MKDVTGQETELGATAIEADLLDAASGVITEHGLAGLTLVRLAAQAGVARMTLHRRGVTIGQIVDALSVRAAGEVQDALFPILAGVDPGAVRLRAAMEALFDVADRHLPLLAGLFAADDGVFHAAPGATGALPTDPVFVAPLVKLMADGMADGTVAAQADLVETATVLFNLAGWGYVQLRHAQRWPPQRARAGVLTLVFDGLDPSTP